MKSHYLTDLLRLTCAVWLSLASGAVWPSIGADLAPVLRAQWPGGNRVGVTVVRVFGDYAYVGYGGERGFEVFDLANPVSPTRLGGHAARGSCSDIAVNGDYAFVSTTAGMEVFNISNRSQPTRMADVPPQYCRGVAASGHYVYLGHRDGLDVLDVADPGNPLLIGQWSLPYDIVMKVALSGSYAFLACYDAGLIVLDVSNPAEPRQIGAYDTAGSTEGVVVADTKAYVADQEGGMEIIDISDPSNPRHLGGYAEVFARFLSVSGDYIFATGDGSGMHVIDVTDPTRPRQVGSFGGQNGFGLAVYGKYALMIMGGIVQILDISDPTEPVRVGDDGINGVADEVAVSGGYAYLADYDAGLRVFSLAHPDSFQQVGRLFTGFSTRSVAVSGSLAYVAAAGGLQVVDIHDPTHPALLGSIPTEGVADKVVVSGHLAFVVNWNSDWRIFDVSDSTAPRLLGRYMPADGAVSQAVISGQRAYVAVNNSDTQGGVVALDISDPAGPVVLGHYRMGSTRSLAAVGDFVYAVNASVGMKIIDFSDARNPQAVNAFYGGNLYSGISIAGRHAFLTGHSDDSGSNLRLFGISDPANPEPAGVAHTGPVFALNNYHVELVGNRIYLARSQGLLAYELTGLPVLTSIQAGQDALNISWNQSALGMKLQRSPTIGNPVWQDVPGSESSTSAVLPTGGGAGFFRLTTP